jgi:uncharacterized membrane protein YhaH (DUF805 family)
MQLVEYWKLVVLERYAKFDGRAGRAEFWWFYLASAILFIAAWILVLILGAIADFLGILGIIALIGLSLALIVPYVAVAIRRLHDTNKTGWFLLLGLIPFGGIVVLIFLATQGNVGANDYGEPDSGLPVVALAA